MFSRIIRLASLTAFFSVSILIYPLSAYQVPCGTPYCRNEERRSWEPIGVDALAWHPDGDHFAIGDEFGIRIYTDTLTLLGNYVFPPVQYLAWSPDGQLLAIASDEQVVIWNAQQHVEVLVLDDTTYPVSWHPDSTRIAVQDPTSSQILVYDLNSAEIIAKYATDGHLFLTQSWNMNGDSIVFVDDFQLFIWTPSTDDLVQIEPLSFHIDWGNWWGNQWSQDKESILITPYDKSLPSYPFSIGIWDYMNAKYRLGRYNINAIPLSFAWSPDEQYIALIGDRESILHILDAETFAVVQDINLMSPQNTMLNIHQCPDSIEEKELGKRLAWNPDSLRVLVASSCRLTIVTVDT